MKTLDANRININSPYKVWTEGEVVHFVTDYGIQYAVDFDYDGNPYYMHRGTGTLCILH